MVRKSKKILSQFLLATYLLVVLHHNVSLLHDAGHCSYAHFHHGFEEDHHDHHFHIGVFHFLGHLLENISHYNYLETTYLSLSQETVQQQKTDNSPSTNLYFAGQNAILNFIVPQSLLNNAFLFAFLQQLQQSDNPLRGPPHFG